MTTGTAVLQQPLQAVKYGAAELKRIIDLNTRKAFIITMSLLLLLALFSFARPYIEAWLNPPPNIVKVRLARVSLDNLPPPQSQNEEPPPPPPMAPQSAPSGPAARAGTPVAVPDAELAADAKDFANVDEINRASAVGGSGEDNGGFADGIGQGNVVIAQKEEEPNIDDFVSVEVEPQYDDVDLAKRLRYPAVARSNGVEGVVVVGALIGKDGRIEKIQVYDSDNKLLEEEALRCVKATTFTPAQQNGQPVRTWVRVPVRFKLR